MSTGSVASQILNEGRSTFIFGGESDRIEQQLRVEVEKKKSQKNINEEEEQEDNTFVD